MRQDVLYKFELFTISGSMKHNIRVGEFHTTYEEALEKGITKALEMID